MVFDFAQRVWNQFVFWSSNPQGPGIQVFFGSVLLLIVTVFFGLALKGNWRWSVAAVPAVAWFSLQLMATTSSYPASPSTVWIALVVVGTTIVLEVLSFAGPFRVSAWAWPGGQEPKNPPVAVGLLVGMGILVGCGTALFSYINGYLILLSRFGNDSGVFKVPDGQWSTAMYLAQVVSAAELSLLGYFALWALYMSVLSLFTRNRQTVQGQLAQCAPVTVGRSYYDQAVFAGDGNVYHLAGDTMRKLRGNVGGTYSYTVMTSFGGRQFMRRPPKLIAPPPESAVVAYAEQQRSPMARRRRRLLWMVGVIVVASVAVIMGPMIWDQVGGVFNSQANAVAVTLKSDTVVVTTNGDSPYGIVLTFGIVIEPGIVVTTYDAVAGATSISTMSAAASIADAKVIGYDTSQDIAVLSVPGIAPSAVDFSSALTVGDRVTVASWSVDDDQWHNLTIFADSTYSATVSALDATSPTIAGGGQTNCGFQATPTGVFTADMADSYWYGNPGSLGQAHPLIDSHGKIVGLGLANTGTATSATVYALPIVAIQSIVATVRSGTSSGTVAVGTPTC